jgi:hypothetical protein
VHGGVVHGGTIWGGEVRGGEVHGGTIWGGEVHGGEVHGGVVHGGVVRGGVVHGGEMHGGVTTCTPLFISNLRWSVLVNDDWLTIGCKAYPIKDWWKFNDATIAAMDPDALCFWKVQKPILKALCKATGRA